MLAEQLVTCRVVWFLSVDRTPALQTRIDKQQDQTYRAQGDARPSDDAAVQSVNTEGAVFGVSR